MKSEPVQKEEDLVEPTIRMDSAIDESLSRFSQIDSKLDTSNDPMDGSSCQLTREERKEKIKRYLEKKKRRKSAHSVRYAC